MPDMDRKRLPALRGSYDFTLKFDPRVNLDAAAEFLEAPHLFTDTNRSKGW